MGAKMQKFLVVNDKGQFYAGFKQAPIGPRVVTPIFLDVEHPTQDGVQVMMVFENGLEEMEVDFKKLGINYTLIPV
jgi:hypothetical protein